MRSRLKILEKIVDIASLSKEERIKYDESIKVYRDNLVTLEFAEQKGKAEGIEIGVEKGIEIGVEKGIEIGVEKGIEKTAKSLKELGFPLEAIAKATGLNIEKIESL